jgi:hypothetical protein
MRGREVFLILLDTCLRGWATLAAEHGTKVVFCLQANHAWLLRTSSPEEEEIMDERFEQFPANRQLFADEADAYRNWYGAALEELCVRRGFGFVDLNSTFDSRELDGHFLFVDPWHLTDEGSGLAARAIMEAV